MTETDTGSSPAAVREKVQAWLMGEGWSVSEKNHADATWLIQAEDRAGRKLLVGQARSPEDQLRIQATVAVAPEHKAKFESLPPETREDALWDLRFRLLGMSVEFDGLGEPLERVTVTQRIYLDGLTKDSFLLRVAAVKNALIAVIWSIGRRLKHVPPPSSDGDLIVH